MHASWLPNGAVSARGLSERRWSEGVAVQKGVL